MTPQALKTANTAAAVLFVLAGFSCFGMAGYLALTKPPAKESKYVQRIPDKKGCKDALAAQGFHATEGADGKVIFASVTGLKDEPKRQLQEATMAIAMCHMPLKSFCMGLTCVKAGAQGNPQSGVQFALDASTTANPQ
ncbi:hypothetical protein F6X40_17030 [Paraburkholderia sp. UCT31]|uniref:hypothetical protein n=1 Tax=Paraburkholderia sp. UCT31 TaxID=2615209 RepID=UPI0016562BD6|nr:hypothetical protein [Paraburkholderia sp. UCT31]MBC8738481.1 hypothetical protein [Paraburkholderia sp. UCT31]